MKKTIIFYFLCWFCQLPYGNISGQDPLAFVVQPYLQFATENSIHILWETNLESNAQVEYGPAVFGAQSANMDFKTIKENKGNFHEVKLENLVAETSYFWRVVSIAANGQEISSQVLTFKTAVRKESAVKFALIGDTQKNNDTPWAWDKIAEKVWKERPDFVIHAGDLVDKGSRKEDWTQHFFPYGANLMQRVVVYSVLGNHEQDSPLYYQYTTAPSPEYYYTFTYGNIQFFMLDSNRDVAEGSEQYTWLEWELAKSDALWKIVVHHHPPYTSDNNDYGDTSFAASKLGSKTRDLCPLYDKYGVDFCFYGHTHLYERTWPLNNNKINLEEGVIYINTGGAGGYIEDFAPTRSWFSAELQAVHHYCTFSVFQDHLEFKAIDFEGKIIDAFRMKKFRQKPAINLPPAVKIKSRSNIFMDTLSISLEVAFDSLDIVYTLDGSDPSFGATKYTKPIVLKNSATLKARALSPTGKISEVKELYVRAMEPQKATKLIHPKKGVQYEYFEGLWEKVPNFAKLKPISRGTISQPRLEEIKHREDHFGVVLEGYIQVPETGLHRFYINSDDGSRMLINGDLIIDHDGDHGAISKTGETILAKGFHKIKIEYFEARGSQYLEAGYINTNGKEVPWTDKNIWFMSIP